MRRDSSGPMPGMHNEASLTPAERNVIQEFQRDSARARQQMVPIQGMLEQKLLEKKIVLMRYPLLGRFDDTQLSTIAKDPKGQRRTLGDKLYEIEWAIYNTRERIYSGDLNLWTVTPIINATIAGLGLGTRQQQWVRQRAKEAQSAGGIGQLVWLAFNIGLGIAGAMIGGPVGATMALAALTMSTVDAAHSLQEYHTRQDLALTAIDPERAFLNPNELGWEGVWVAVEWIAVGLDVVSAIKAVKALKGGTAIDDVVKESGGKLTREMADDAATRMGQQTVPAP